MSIFIVILLLIGAHCLYAGVQMVRRHRVRQMDNPIVHLERIKNREAYAVWLGRHYFLVGGAAIVSGIAFAAQSLLGLARMGFANTCGLICFVFAAAVLILQAVNTRRFYE